MVDKKNPASEANVGQMSESATGRTLGEGVEIDPIIASLERVYQSLTGSSPPPPGEEAYAPIPVERDPGDYVSQRFEQLLEALQQPTTAGPMTWSPPLTVWESDAEMVVCVDLPGVARHDVELALESDVLTVRGRRPSDHDGARLKLSERPLGPFERRVLLPRRVDRAEPTARLENGVLEVRLGKPRAETAAGKKEIRVS